MYIIQNIVIFLLLLNIVSCGGGGSGGSGDGAPTPAPTLTLSSDQGFVTTGSSVALSWSATSATTCTASSGWSGNKAVRGSEIIQNLTISTTFILECDGPGGSVLRSITITVSDNPTPYTTPYPFVDVLHTKVVFDETRGKLYAHVPSGDVGHPNTFAIIDIASKSVTYTQPIDYVPYTMTVSPDGSYLYLGTADTHEVIRLSLPSFSVDMRMDLGTDPSAPSFWPVGKKFDAGYIAVSPEDPEIYSVSLINNTYWTCAVGLRVYRNSNMITQLFNTVDTSLGDIISFGENGATLTTLCSGQTPEVVSRLTFDGANLAIVDAERGATGSGSTLGVRSNAILTGSGNKFDMPGFTLRGALPPLTFDLQGDPAPIMLGCIFADNTGNTAACLSQTDITLGFPTFRAFVLYELEDANYFLTIPLDLPMSKGASRIFRVGPGKFCVSVGYNDQNQMLIKGSRYMHQNTRIYFLDGISTAYPQ